MEVPVVIVDYDAAWPAMYEAERALIAGALGDRAVHIEGVERKARVGGEN